MQLPHELPVMALPNAVLFPQAMMPLRIFEPRYREMLADCLESDRFFSAALREKGWEILAQDPPAYPVAGIGLIRASVGQPNGTSHLVLQGIARAQIVTYRQQSPYPVAEIEILETNHTDSVQVDALAAKVAELVENLSRLGYAPPEVVFKYLTSQSDPERLTDLASDLLLSDFYAKQKILEALDLRERLHKLVVFLQKDIERQALQKKLQGPPNHGTIGNN